MYNCELRVWRKMTKMRPQVVHAPPLTTTNIRCTAHLSTLPFYFHGKDGTYSSTMIRARPRDWSHQLIKIDDLEFQVQWTTSAR